MANTDSKQRYRFSPLTDADISNIREVLVHAQDIDNENIDDIIFSVDTACGGALAREEVGDPREMREELSKFLDSISNALNSADNMSFHSRRELEDGYSEDGIEEDSDLEVFQGSGVSGEGVWALRIRLRAAKKLAKMALERIDIPRGAPTNVYARELALAIREAFEDHNITATSYDDGVYMKILEIAFATLLPDTGTESHRRHGKWALRVEDPLNDIDWNTMKVDLID